MLSLSVKGDYKKVLKDLALVENTLTAKARQAALRRTAAAIRKQALTRTAAEIGLPQKFIRKRFKVFTNAAKQQASVWVGMNRIRLIDLTDAMTPHKAARFMQGVEGLPFLARMPSGHVGWYQRKAGSKHKLGRNHNTNRPELPIDEVKLDYSNVADRQLLRAGDAIGPRVFPGEFEEALRKQLAKHKPYAR